MRLVLSILAVLFLVSTLIGGVAVAQDMKEVTILYWQAASILNPYLSSGSKDADASTIILEPLANIAPSGALVPTLATEIPTLENGGIPEDQTSITWNLRDDVLWSDGTPFTADDVVFTWEYCTHPEAGCVQSDEFSGIVSVEAMGMHLVKISFDGPKHILSYPSSLRVHRSCRKRNSANAWARRWRLAASRTSGQSAPAPSKLRSSAPTMSSSTSAMRTSATPIWASPTSTAWSSKVAATPNQPLAAVLETGEADYAWNLQISPAVLGRDA